MGANRSRRSKCALAFVAACGFSPALGCKYDLPVDNHADNPGIDPPAGIVQGTINYYGPPPCFRNGKVEGALVLLVFPFDNPPPPEGLATTATTFATVPGERLFEGISHPNDKEPGGGASSFCPPVDGPPMTASAPFTVSQLNAGRYQIRAFYSRQNRFFPLYDFANLPNAGDIGGGAVVNPTAPKPTFISVNVGVPVDPAHPEGALKIPDLGFLLQGVPVVVGQLFRANRPYFNVDYDGSQAFINPKGTTKDVNGSYPYDDPVPGSQAGLVFPQDHPITSQQDITSTTGDFLKIAQASLPSIHFKYGFPGNSADPNSSPADAWIALHAKPNNPFPGSNAVPYYGIDPFSFNTDESKGFVLTRNFNPDGSRAVLVDNTNLEQNGKIADLFPQVVLAKLQEDDLGNLIDPPTPQVDPIVIVQGFTLHANSMTATSESLGVDLDPGKKPLHPLLVPGGEEIVDNFTAMIRPAALCVRPQAGDFRGTLVVPYGLDPNPKNFESELVSIPRILEVQAARVKAVEFGCMPPGYYSINVIYPTGQAWSVPNQTGYCTYTVTGELTEECYRPLEPLGALTTAGFPKRPYLASQMAYKTDPKNGQYLIGTDGKPVPQIVRVLPSDRCMKAVTVPVPGTGKTTTIYVNHPTHEDTNHNGKLDPGEDANGNSLLDFSVFDACVSYKPTGAACVDSQQCFTKQCSTTTKVCVAKARNEACGHDNECASLNCDAKAGKCGGNRAGLTCTAGGDCASGACGDNGLCK